MFGRTITLEKIGATTAEAYRMKSCFHLATPADASWLNVSRRFTCKSSLRRRAIVNKRSPVKMPLHWDPAREVVKSADAQVSRHLGKAGVYGPHRSMHRSPRTRKVSRHLRKVGGVCSGKVLVTGIKEAQMRSLASPVRVKWFAALAVGGVSYTKMIAASLGSGPLRYGAQ